MTASALLADESMVKLLLQEREGGETAVETPVGFVDLVTDEYIRQWPASNSAIAS